MGKFIRRGIKALLFLLVGVGVLLVGTLLALPAIIGSNWGKSTVCAFVSSSLGRQLECRGGLTLALGQSVSFSASDLHLLQPAGFPEGEMLSVGRVEVVLPLLTTLFTHPTFDSIVVENVEVRVDSVEGGRSNWSFGDGESAPQIEDEESTSIMVPLIKSASIKSVSVGVNAPGKSNRYLLEQLNVQGEESGEPSEIVRGDGLVISGSGALDGLPLSLRGKVGSVSSLLAGEFTQVEVTALSEKHEVKAKGQVNIKGALDLDASARGDTFSTFAAPLLSGLPGWSPYSIALHAHSTTPSKFTFSAISSKLGRVDLSGEVTLEKLEKSPLDLRANVLLPQHGVQLSGRLHKGGQVDLAVKGEMRNLTELNDLFLTPLPNVSSFAVDADLTYLPAIREKSDTVQVRKLLVSLAESDVAGVGEVHLLPFSIKGALTSKKINYTALTRAIAAVSAEEAPPSTTEPVKESKKGGEFLPLESLLGMHIDLQVSLQEVVGLVASSIRDITTKVTIADGALAVSTFNGKAFDGTIGGDLVLSANRSTAQIKGVDIDAKHLLQAVGQSPFIEGKFVLSTDLATSGRALDSMLGSLSGTVEVSSDHADFKSQALSLSASGLQRILSPIFKKGPSTPSDCILMNFIIQNGIARSNGNVVNLGDVFLFAQGEMNFAKNTITYSCNVNSANPSLASLIPPFRAVGALNNPFFIPSTSGTVASVFDSAEGVFDSALGVVTSTARFILSAPGEKFEGTALCKKALEVESRRMSSRVGGLLSSEGGAK